MGAADISLKEEEVCRHVIRDSPRGEATRNREPLAGSASDEDQVSFHADRFCVRVIRENGDREALCVTGGLANGETPDVHRETGNLTHSVRALASVYSSSDRGLGGKK